MISSCVNELASQADMLSDQHFVCGTRTVAAALQARRPSPRPTLLPQRRKKKVRIKWIHPRPHILLWFQFQIQIQILPPKTSFEGKL